MGRASRRGKIAKPVVHATTLTLRVLLNLQRVPCRSYAPTAVGTRLERALRRPGRERARKKQRRDRERGLGGGGATVVCSGYAAGRTGAAAVAYAVAQPTIAAATGWCAQRRWWRQRQPWWAQWRQLLDCWASRARTQHARTLTVLCAQLLRYGTSSADGRWNASSSTAARHPSDLRAHATASAHDRGAASSSNEAGRAAHLERRHRTAADETPGRPMRGDDRCGRSDPHIGSFGVGWPQPANSRSSGGTPRDTRKERRRAVLRVCLDRMCAW